MPPTSDVNEVFLVRNEVSLIRMKNQQKIKALLDGTDVVIRVPVLPRSRSRSIL